MTWTKPALALALWAAAIPAARAGGELALPIPFEGFPDYVAVGVGAAPDYLGSDDYFVGPAPAANWDFGPAKFRLLGNWAMIDLLPDSGWIVGPAGVLRFGRRDVEDVIVARMKEIDYTVDLGVSFGREFVDPENPVKRFSIGGDLLHDAGGVHGGLVANAYVRGSHPTWWRGGAAVGIAGATYGSDSYTDTYFSVSRGDAAASGLGLFDAGGGVRDVRVGFGLFQSLSPSWHLGVAAMYSRLLGDAADSPIVSDRGSDDQLTFGAGVAYAWGFER